MKHILKLTLLPLVAVGAYGQQGHKESSAPDYHLAISQSRVAEGSDRKPWIRNCIRQWDNLSEKREVLFKELAETTGDFKVALEIGNSAFVRYEYVMVVGDRLKTNLGRGDRSLNESEVEGLKKLVVSGLESIRGDATDPSFDANCYFLTLHLAGVTKQIAIYGEIRRTEAADLIARLISLSEKRGSDSGDS